MRAALELLRACTMQLPPPPGCHHSLTLQEDNKLHLTLRLVDLGFVDLILSEYDFSRPLAVLMQDVKHLAFRKILP